MLTSFFSKSKPASFVVVSLYILVFYILANTSAIITGGVGVALKKIGVFAIFLMSVFLVNFVSKRNDLTSRNAYKTILYGSFCCMFFAVLRDTEILAANFFILLALRRIVSLRSQRDTVQKIFDATFWIGIASLFYFWSILFLFLVYFGVLVHEGYRFKNWLVPLISLLILYSLANVFDLLTTDTFFRFSDWFQSSSFDFSAYRELQVLMPLAFLLALTIWASFFYVGVINRASATTKISLVTIFISAAVSLLVAFVAPYKDGSELLFFFAPLAIIVTNYFQTSKDRFFREILLWIIILIPLVLIIFF